MRLYFALVALSATSCLTIPSATLAGEQTLELKLVTAPIDVKVVQAANMDGQSMSAGQYFGVAYFKDGRIAVKNFISTADTLNGSGSIRGYSTYTFDDSSSITASYTGEVKAGVRTGKYTIVSGTCTFSNASGTGTFDGVASPSRAPISITASSS
jgi:hypothetical protein